MRIGELAKLTGLAASRIRFYEAIGLIKGVMRKANGYRDYGPEAVLILEIIGNAQSAGFTLDEIRQLLPMGSGNWSHSRLLEALKQKVSEIEILQKRLKQNKAQLLIAIDSIENRPSGIECADNTKRVLDRLRKKGVMSSHPRTGL